VFFVQPQSAMFAAWSAVCSMAAPYHFVDAPRLFSVDCSCVSEKIATPASRTPTDGCTLTDHLDIPLLPGVVPEKRASPSVHAFCETVLFMRAGRPEIRCCTVPPACPAFTFTFTVSYCLIPRDKTSQSHTHTHTHARTHTRTHTHSRSVTHIHTHIHTHTHTQSHTHTHTHAHTTHTHTPTHTHTHARCARTHTHTHTLLHTLTHNPQSHTHTHALSCTPPVHTIGNMCCAPFLPTVCLI
jgi:hypothetical protein